MARPPSEGRPRRFGFRSDAAAVAIALAAFLLMWIAVPVRFDLDPASLQREQGLAWYVDLAKFESKFFRIEGDASDHPQRSPAVLFEDGRALGPAHAMHDDIRTKGRGLFSHWHGGLYFSTSDGSDAATNGRRYALKAGVKPPLWAIVLVLACSIGFLARHLRGLSWRALRSQHPVRVDARLYSLGWIVVASVPVLLVSVATLALFRWHRGAELLVRPPSIEYSIVDAQVARARAGRAFDVAFVGDSSCLMGVDSSQLASRLGGLRVENFCTLGYVGPVGYAHMLDDLAKHATSPDAVLVIMMHGVQLERHPSWDAWPEYVRTMGRSAERSASVASAARFSLWNSLDPAVFSVLPGSYGRFYASENAVRTAVEKGTVIQDGIRDKSPDKAFRYRPNAAFLAAASTLGKAIERFGRRAFLVISPIPGDEEDDITRQERLRVTAEVAQLLGIPAERVLDTPPTLPAELFASTTHLGPGGRAYLTEMLAGTLTQAGAGR